MRILKHTKKNNNIDKIKYDFYVFDTETTCLEPQPKNFVFGCLYGYNTRKYFYTVEDFIKEFSNKKYKDKYIFAHNAEFDLLTIFGNVFTKVDNAAIFNGKFICAKYKDLLFADSMNIYPTSVYSLGHLIGLPKLENEKAKQGRLTKKNITEEDKKYCMRDCEIVYKALLRIFEMTGVIKATLPSLAMYDFRRYYMEEDIPFKELVDEFYESYYGGRCEAFFIGKTDANVYDINSMYPKAMSQVRLPNVKTLLKTSMCDILFLEHCLKFYEGMAKVTVQHASTFFGYLPCRMKINGNIKLVFPVGEFTTTVNFNELRFAIDAGVVVVKKVHYVIYGNPVKSIFEEYIADNYAKRKQAEDSLEKLIYKNKMNSLYGRFAMRMKLLTTYYEMIPYQKIEELKEAAKYCDIKLFNATRADCFLVTENEKSQNSYYSIPAIASYITSEARVMLLKNLLANENNGMVYCDTDSIFLSGSFTGKVDDDLGSFKKENKKIIEVCGLKNYKYIDGEGKTHIVIKGISKGSIKKTTARCGEEIYESQKYYKTKASLRQGHEAGSGYTMVKHVSNNYDKREVLSDGNTRCLISKNDFLINATTFIRPKSDYFRKRAEQKRFRYEPQDIREAVMMFFVTGGKVWTEDLKSHVTGSSANELKSYFGLYSKDGIHMDVFCETVPDAFYTDRIIDVFQDVLLSYNTTTKMREELEKRKIELEEKQKKQIVEYEFEYEDVPF
jgi:hypothetical protein